MFMTPSQQKKTGYGGMSLSFTAGRINRRIEVQACVCKKQDPIPKIMRTGRAKGKTA
jgi:hypothetical protein